MTFASPEYFYLLLLIVPLVLWHFLSRRKREASLKMASTEAYRYVPKSPRMALVQLPFLLRVLTLVLVVIILARPQTSHSLSDTETEGIDIMMVMDISTSMLAQDLKPNRIEAAKEVATEFIAGRPTDNIGLTVFAGEAFTQCPMTVDHAVLLSMFRGVSCDLPGQGLIDDGTAIGMGLANAISRLKDSQAKSKVIILLTDGVNNRGDISPLTAAEIAKQFGVRVYTIGVGAGGTAPSPSPLPGGGVHIVNMPVDVDPETLQQIAQTTGGLFYRAGSSQKLKEIYNDIDKLEKSKLKVTRYDKRYEAYAPFAVAALLSLLLEFLLRTTWLRRIP